MPDSDRARTAGVTSVAEDCEASDDAATLPSLAAMACVVVWKGGKKAKLFEQYLVVCVLHLLFFSSIIDKSLSVPSS